MKNVSAIYVSPKDLRLIKQACLSTKEPPKSSKRDINELLFPSVPTSLLGISVVVEEDLPIGIACVEISTEDVFDTCSQVEKFVDFVGKKDNL